MPRLSAIFLCLLISSFQTQPLWAQESSTTANRVASAANTSSASELAKQVAAAYGGMAKIKEMLNRGNRSHGTLSTYSGLSTASNTFECEFISKGSKLRIQMPLLGQDKIEVYDGKNGWSEIGGWVSPSDRKTAERIAEELKHGLNALANLDDPSCKLELLPEKQVNGKLCDLLKLSNPDGSWTLFYIDRVSKLVTRSEFIGFDTEQGIESLKATDYSDYRTIMGFPTPFKLIEYVSGRKTQEALLDAVTVDDNINDELFQMPQESSYERLARGPVTLPFEFSGNEILIKARVNNGPEAKFILDTGASQTVIDKATAQSLGPTTVLTFSVTAGSKAVPLSYTTLNNLHLGELTLDNIATLITDLSSFGAAIGEKPAGLIGANVLKRFLLTIDFQDKKITLADPRSRSVPENATIVPSSPVFASTALVVKGILDGHEMNFLVDTGASFNNLPLSLASKIHSGPILAVGQMQGLDGQKTSIGSVRFKTLKLEDYTVKNPVFALQPDKGTKPASGLFAAKSLGILGNPIWSKTRLTIDYRNDRLFIEAPANKQQLDSFLALIEETDRSYLKGKNLDLSAAAYEKLLKKAEAEKLTDMQALCLSRISGLYADKFRLQKESQWLDLAAREYERAAKLAAESRNRNVEGQILADWAMLYLDAPRSNNDLISAQTLLKKALARCPSDASICAALGSAMLKTGKNPLGSKYIDQALMLDPSNWQALWAKYRILESEKRTGDIKLLLLQIARYYPDYPDLKDAQAKLNKTAPAPKTAAAKKPVQRPLQKPAPKK